MGFLRIDLCSVALILLVGAAPASATSFTNGEFESYSQNSWGADPGAGPPASLITNHFDALYPTGMLVGNTAGYFMLFTEGGNGDALLTFLPQVGPPAPLNATLVDPTSSASGIFGGQVAGLRLNIDFGDAGLLAHLPGVAFGDLVLTGFGGSLAGLDGLSVRDFSVIANNLLAGLFEPYAIGDFSAVLMMVNGAFEGGFVTSFAPDHLALPTVTAPVPEPSSWLVMLAGLGVCGSSIRRMRRGRAKRGI